MSKKNIRILFILISFAISFNSACSNKFDATHDNIDTTSMNAQVSSSVLSFDNVNDYFNFRKDHLIRQENFILIPTKSFPDSKLKNIQFVDDVYIATYYEITNDYKNNFSKENQSYERNITSEAVYMRYLYDDPEITIKEGFIKKDFVFIDNNNFSCYYLTEYGLSDTEDKLAICHNIVYI